MHTKKQKPPVRFVQVRRRWFCFPTAKRSDPARTFGVTTNEYHHNQILVKQLTRTGLIVLITLVILCLSCILGILTGLLISTIWGFLVGGSTQFWLYTSIPISLYFIFKYAATYIGLTIWKLRYRPMARAWERLYGTSFLMPPIPEGRAAEICSCSGSYQVFRGDREIREVLQGMQFPRARVKRNPYAARWEMVEYPLRPEELLLKSSLFRRLCAAFD